MKIFAHRGVIDYENTIDGVLKIFNTTCLGVEIDVRYNTAREVILCHDRENRNEPNDKLEDLLIMLQRFKIVDRNLMIDIKAFGITNAKKLAMDVCHIIAKFPTLCNLYLCSFNEYCVSELCFNKDDMCLPNVSVGVITSGIPLGLFRHIEDISFVSIEYSILCEEIMEQFKELEVFAWVVNDLSMKQLMCKYKVSGIIQDIYSNV